VENKMQKKKSINTENADVDNQEELENNENYELNEIIENLLIITTGTQNID
jgi:hypothetical protein